MQPNHKRHTPPLGMQEALTRVLVRQQHAAHAVGLAAPLITIISYFSRIDATLASNAGKALLYIHAYSGC